MGDEPSPNDVVDALVQRYDILTNVTDGPITQAELREQTDVSRATVHRVVTKFEDLHIVEADDGEYDLTKFGERVVERHQTYLDAIEVDCRLERFVSSASKALSYDSPVLDGAEIFFQQSGSADEAIYQNKSIVENARRVRKVLDGIMASYFLVHLDPTKYEDQEVEVILPDTLADTVVNTYEEELQALFKTGNFKLFRTSEPVEFSTMVAETREDTFVILKVHAEGSVKCAARNDTESAQQWAESRYDRFRRNATPVRFRDNWTEVESVD